LFIDTSYRANDIHEWKLVTVIFRVLGVGKARFIEQVLDLGTTVYLALQPSVPREHLNPGKGYHPRNMMRLRKGLSVGSQTQKEVDR